MARCLIFVLVFFFTSHAQAGDMNAKTTSDGTVKALSKTDTISSQNVTTTRSIRVLKRESDQAAEPVAFHQTGHTAWLTASCFAPEGRRVATGDDSGRIRIWDLASGRVIRVINAHKEKVGALAFSPDGRYLASTGDYGDKRLIIWDLATGKPAATFPYNNTPHGMAYMPDGDRMIIGVGVHLVMLNIKEAREIYRVKCPNSVYTLALNRDGRRVLTGQGDRVARLYDTASGQLLRELKYHKKNSILYVAISPDGMQALTTDGREPVVYWDLERGRRKDKLKLGKQYASRVYFTPDGKNGLIWSRQALLWDLEKDKVMIRSNLEKKDLSDAQTMSLSPDGTRILTGGHGKVVYIWDAATGALVRKLTAFSEPEFIRASAVNHQETYLAVSGRHQGIRIIDLKTAEPVGKLPGHRFDSVALGFFSDGIRLAAGGDEFKHSIRIFDVTSGKKANEIVLGHNIHRLAISPDDGRIASNDAFSSYVLDLASGRETKLALPPRFSPRSVGMTPDGNVLVAGESGPAALYNGTTGRYIRTFCQDCGSDWISITPDGRYATTCARLLDLHTGKIRNFSAGCSTNAVNRDGTRAMFSADNTGSIWMVDLTTGKTMWHRQGQGTWAKVVGMGFLLDRGLCWAAHNSGVVRFMELDSGKERLVFYFFKEDEWLAVTPEGYYSGSADSGRNLNVRVGEQVMGIDAFEEVFQRPDLVAQALSGRSTETETQPVALMPQRTLAQAAQSGPPPKVAFVKPTTSFEAKQRDVQITIEVTDQGGGIGRILWKINGLTLGVSEENVAGKLSRLISLAPGKNHIEIIALNSTNEIAASPVSITATLNDAISGKPDLHILALGIDKYRDKALWLNFSVKDATSLARALEQHAGNVYGKVTLQTVFDQQASLDGIREAFAEVAPLVQTQDVFVLYMAGHGVAMDGRYYFLPFDFRFRNEESIREQGLHQDHLTRWLAQIKARKSLVLMDTCNSGAFIAGGVRMRNLAEKTAVSKLTRATGRAVIVAAKDNQPALEGYEGHGVFTYSVLQAFNEADRKNGNQDNLLSIFELSAYLDETVPAITYKAFGYEQIPQVNLSGRDFPIAVTAP